MVATSFSSISILWKDNHVWTARIELLQISKRLLLLTDAQTAYVKTKLTPTSVTLSTVSLKNMSRLNSSSGFMKTYSFCINSLVFSCLLFVVCCLDSRTWMMALLRGVLSKNSACDQFSPGIEPAVLRTSNSYDQLGHSRPQNTCWNPGPSQVTGPLDLQSNSLPTELFWRMHYGVFT